MLVRGRPRPALEVHVLPEHGDFGSHHFDAVDLVVPIVVTEKPLGLMPRRSAKAPS
jgi:hypothetical protein